MKIEENNITDISIGITEQNSFKLNQDSGILYDILRSKMYKDPIGAIVREIASNSRDANRAAGRGDVPIKVFFKNSEEEKNYLFDNDSITINFQDNGLGMSPDKINDIYLVYGASDKRGNNDLTGGFGLGCKTPFAHCDTFSITTIFEGSSGRMKYTYIASIDKTNKGKLSLLDSEETKEETGTLISIPIEKGYLNEFKNSCNFFFKYWDIPIEGFECEEPLKSYDNCNIYSVNKNQEIFLLIDNIYYPLENHKDINTKDFWNRIDINLNIGLKFKTGEIEVQPSREGIRYTRETVESINNILATLEFNEIVKDLLENVDCTNYRDFKLDFLNRYVKHIKDEKLHYIVKNIYPKYRSYNRNIPNFLYYTKRSWNNTYTKSEVGTYNLIDLVAKNNTVYILSPIGETFKYKANKQALIKRSENHLIITDFGTKLENPNICNELINILNLFDNVKSDYEVEYTPVKNVRVNTAREDIPYRYLKGNIPLRTSTNDNLEDAILVEIDNLNTFDKNYKDGEYELLQHASRELDVAFLFVSNRYTKHFINNVTLKHYQENNKKFIRLQEKIKEYERENAIIDACNGALNSRKYYFLSEELNKLFPNVFLPADKLELKFYYEYFVKNKTKSCYGIDSKTYEETCEIIEKLEEKYPIINLIHDNIKKESLDQLKQLKNGKNFQTHLHSINNNNNLRRRKIELKKERFSRRLRKGCKLSRTR